ncbi:EAL domain-containing protein [Amphritea atlantica]|uniref:EAL domain-containing protein n=1 Tax=Amphritea atlantica TaxID=355243 RepID=A0ABY5GWW4_9GAMM|nr:EAL domain-containing protein [Amphritea atlantica]
MRNSNQKKPPSFARWVYGGVLATTLLFVTVLWFSFMQSIEERSERSALYARMIEGMVTRTLEGLEVSLVSLSDDLIDGDLRPGHTQRIRDKALKILKFAPQLRQIVVVKGDKTLADTHTDSPYNINLNILGLDRSVRSSYSLGLIVGNSLKGRFLPPEGTFPDEASLRELIPIAIETRSPQGERLLIIATFNPSYLTRYIGDLELEKSDSVYLTDVDGNVLLQQGLFGPNRQYVIPHLKAILSEGADEHRINNSFGAIPLNTTAIRLLTKYPLTVAIVVDHKDSFSLWLQQKHSLLLILLVAVLILIGGALFVVRNGRRAIEMKAEVALLSEVVEHSPTVIVITNPDGVIEYVNECFETVTGYHKHEVIGRTPRVLKSGETSDIEYINMWKTLTAGQTWQGEFHNKHKDGSLYWERSSIGPLINEAGEITHYIALKQPITAEKKAQEKLRLASAVFSVAAEAIMVTDAQNRIQMVNESFEQITGYSEAEVLGKTPAILKSGHHTPDFYQAIYLKLEESRTWEGEVWNQRKNGEVYPQWLTISSRFNPAGELEGYVALFSDITQRKHDEAIIIHQANYDTLTGLCNRHLFEDRLKQALALSDRSQTKTALLFIDLDRFKYVNDTFGHFAGDQLLKEVAERITSCIRKSDTVARLGGDEFAVVIPELARVSAIEGIAQKILQSLVKPYRLGKNEAYISCSIGIAIYPDNGSDSERLLLNADNAMYKAKQRGRNTREYFNQQLNEDSKRRSLLEQDLYKALERDQFYLLYQPIWSVDGSRIESVEALIRWQHPTRGMVSPNDFIPIAEESVLIHSIGKWVIQEACRFARQLSDSYANAPKVSMNISSSQFRRGNVAAQLTDELTALKLKGSALVVEITESILLLDEQKIFQQLESIVSMGTDIAVDDFGTGYSSLSYLKKYPVQRLKIDKSFIDDLESNQDTQSLVSGMISLADSLSLKTVVEGVETQGQLDLLKQFGSPMIQGYLLARPMTGDMLLTLLKNRTTTAVEK